MTLTQIDFTEKEEELIFKIRQKFNLNKPNAVKKIIELFFENKEENLI